MLYALCLLCVLCQISKHIVCVLSVVLVSFLIRCIYANIIITVSAFSPHSLHVAMNPQIVNVEGKNNGKKTYNERNFSCDFNGSNKDKKKTSTELTAVRTQIHTNTETNERLTDWIWNTESEEKKIQQHTTKEKATASRRIIQFKHTDILLATFICPSV